MSAATTSLTAPDTFAQPEQHFRDRLHWDLLRVCWPLRTVLHFRLGRPLAQRAMDKAAAERHAEYVRTWAHAAVDEHVNDFLWALHNGIYGPGKLTLHQNPPA